MGNRCLFVNHTLVPIAPHCDDLGVYGLVCGPASFVTVALRATRVGQEGRTSHGEGPLEALVLLVRCDLVGLLIAANENGSGFGFGFRSDLIDL